MRAKIKRSILSLAPSIARRTVSATLLSPLLRMMVVTRMRTRRVLVRKSASSKAK